MGVIRRTIEPKAIRIEDSDHDTAYADYDLTESDAESVQNTRVVTATASRTQKKKEAREFRRLTRFHDSVETGGVFMRKNMGQRKWRRVENARFLLSMIDRDDIVDDFSDMLERSNTAFDELFNDSAKMAVWNDFIAKDEEEQARLLEEARCITRKEAGALQPGSWFRVGGRREATEVEKSKKSGGEGEEKEEREQQRGQGDEGDKRRHHPAYSASSCFARLSPKLRNFFNDKSLPWPLIDRADRELRDFFNGLPDGRWRRPIDNSRHRLAMHAVSAFLMLSSKTTKEGNKDVVEIENRRPYFIPPHSLLIAYLATKRKTPIEFIPEPRWPDDVIIEEEEEDDDDDDDKTIIDGASDTSDSVLDSSFEIV
ncbi:hypothetical protein PFISCL1PPCAC_4615 [Pristionchus fissidentatus]|uniref:R3H-associated N-terminal domain-containing protein n=1 Tax=Pristionchus fissidentatus TaxID=1538716 RepID=A0AAV5V4X1_9BILA|nr:hypothetical protein PFISCL1PPCAC_4615 [Pristionchus fissidentatus]